MDAVSRLTGWLATAAARAVLAVQSAQAGRQAAAAAPPSDWALWHAACDGNPRSAAELVRTLTPQAYGLAVQIVGKREDAQDAVQDAFLRLWRSRPSDTHGARLATYFNTIVINCCRSQLGARREQATEHDTLTALHDAMQAHDDHRHAAPAAGSFEAGAGQTHAGLNAALKRLPTRQRMAIVMWAYADASAADIAHALDIDPNAAHQLLHRAKLALRTQIEGGS